MTRATNLVAWLVLVSAAAGSATAAESYTVEPSHTSVYFKISHLGLSQTFGRFNEVSGKFVIDGAQSKFSLTINPESVDTGNTQRDAHLRSPDFFNSKQFPSMSFTSKTVKPIKGGFDVTGDLTFHGVTKPVSFQLMGGTKAEFPPKVFRTGYTTDLTIKRSDFGIDKSLEAIGDDVDVAISFEGTKN